MHFVTVDVETANEWFASICQLGMARFEDGQLVDTFKSYVNPQTYFSPINVHIHGIDEDTVEGAPTWEEVQQNATRWITDQIVGCHTHFDRVATADACDRYGLPPWTCQWLDTARVTRRAWPEFAYSGYGLSDIASYLGISYKAHDALEDAVCAGKVLQHAIDNSGITLEDWFVRVRRPIHLGTGTNCDSEKRVGELEGLLQGEVLVFTGSLSLRRTEAADLAAKAGCNVDSGVTKRTTLLVVGDQDLSKLAGKEKSSKHLKAESLIQTGQQIRILAESDFIKLISVAA